MPAKTDNNDGTYDTRGKKVKCDHGRRIFGTLLGTEAGWRIHPFGDGNGRISRLMMNFVLQKHNYPMLDIPYEKRNSYYTALERSQIKRDNAPFLNWFFRRYLKEYGKLLK